jgi:hypothetical protein
VNPLEILDAVRLVAGSRLRADGFNVLNSLLKQHSHLSPQEGRRDFVAGLRILAEQGAIKLPVQAEGWDQLGQTPLPKWVQLVVEETAPSNNWDHRTHPWHPRLTFLAQLSHVARPDEVCRLNAWLQQMPADEPFVPVKERSWEILGDEKRLEAIAKTTLFQSDRLSWEVLRCYVVPHIPPHRVYPSAAPVMMISENEAGFDSFCRASEKLGTFRCVVLGNGLAIDKATEFLGKAVGDYGISTVFYLGDVDALGLAIGRRVTADLVAKFSLVATPWIPGYAAMLDTSLAAEGPVSGDCAWLPPPLGARATALLASGQRAAQEGVGWKQLKSILGDGLQG